MPACATDKEIVKLICELMGIIDLLLVVVASIALLVFFWGIVKYIVAQGNESAKASAKKIMVGGVVALFVLFSVFGIIRFIQNAFGIDPTGLGDNVNMPAPGIRLPASNSGGSGGGGGGAGGGGGTFPPTGGV